MTDPTQTIPLPLFVTVAQAATLSSTSESTIRRMIKNGSLAVTYFGSSPRIRTADLQRSRSRHS